MSARKVPTQCGAGQQQLELQLPPIDSPRVLAHSHLACLAAAAQWLPRACTAALAAPPLWRVCRQEILVHARLRPEVPGAAVYHVRRVVWTCARVIERNRALIFRVPSHSYLVSWCLRWGIWGSGRSDQSFCPITDIYNIFFRQPPLAFPSSDRLITFLSNIYPFQQDGTESPLVAWHSLACYHPFSTTQTEWGGGGNTGQRKFARPSRP